MVWEHRLWFEALNPTPLNPKILSALWRSMRDGGLGVLLLLRFGVRVRNSDVGHVVRSWCRLKVLPPESLLLLLAACRLQSCNYNYSHHPTAEPRDTERRIPHANVPAGGPCRYWIMTVELAYSGTWVSRCRLPTPCWQAEKGVGTAVRSSVARGVRIPSLLLEFLFHGGSKTLPGIHDGWTDFSPG